MSRFWKGLRDSFLAGLIVVAPVAVSIIILVGLFDWVTGFLVPAFVRVHLEKLPYPESLFRLLALGIVLVLVTLLGWLTRWVVGKRMVAVTESMIERVPLLNKTYGFVKEVSNTVLAGQKTMFQRVVLVEYPRPGIYAIGFVTNDTPGEIVVKTGKTMVNVFFPLTPPTGGWLVLVPLDQTINLEMTVAEGMKMVASAGTVVPHQPPKPLPPPAPQAP